MNKKTIILLTISLTLLTPLCAIKIYDKNDIEAHLNTELSLDYNYEACDFPGTTGFDDPSTEISLELEYLNNLNLNISYDYSDSSLNDAYMQYKFFDPLRIKLGRFKVEYGREETSNYRPQTIHSDASDNFTPGRSTGISIYGKELLNLFNYNVAFTNDYNSEEDNDTSQHTLTLMVDKDISIGDNYNLTPGYNILYNSDEIFSHGCFLELSHKNNEAFHILMEYMEQRYYNYYWNRSIYLSTSYRFSLLEPFIHGEYYDNYIDEDTDDDAIISGAGLNLYQINNNLKLTLSYTNRYLYTKNSTSNDPIMYHTFSIQTEVKL